MPEVRDWAKVYMWYCDTFDRLTTAKDCDTALALKAAYEAAEAQYKADLDASSHDSLDIYFSSYMTEWLQRLGE